MGDAEDVDVEGGRSGAGASIVGVLVCDAGGAGVLGFAFAFALFPVPFNEGDHDSKALPAPPEVPADPDGPSV